MLSTSPEFVKLWFATIISNVGDWLTFPFLVAFSSELAKNTSLEMVAISLLFLSRTVPPLLFASLGGIIIDKFNRKHVLVITNVVRAVLALCFIQAIHQRSLLLVYAICFLQFTFSAIFEPGESALLPSLVRPEDAVRANTLMSVSWAVICALGAMLGGLVYPLIGATWCFILDSLTFVAASVLIALIQPAQNRLSLVPRDGPKLSLEEQGAEDPSALDSAADDAPFAEPASSVVVVAAADATAQAEDASFMDGLRFAFASPLVMLAMTMKLVMVLSDITTVISVLAVQRFPMAVELQAGFWFCYGLGATVGSLLSQRVGKVKEPATSLKLSILISSLGILLSWCFVFIGVAVAEVVSPAAEIYVFATSFGFAMLSRGIYGCFVWIISQVMIQLFTPDQKLGRMFGFDWLGLNLGLIINTLVTGLLMQVLSDSHILLTVLISFLVCAAPNIVWCICSAIHLRNYSS